MKFTTNVLILLFGVLMQANAANAESTHEPPDQQGVSLALSIIIAVVAAAIAYVSERLKQRRESKIKAYEAMMSSIGAYIRATDTEKKAAALEKFSDVSMTFCVWADKAVLTALSEYMRDSTNISNPEKRTDVVLLRKRFTMLVAAIRKDIGMEFAVNDAVGTITFGDEWEKTPRAASVQIPNPLFVEAQDISQELNSSILNDKSEWTKRFHNLEQEQQLLMSLAEQVDGGQCTGSCVNLYNSRVVAWESSLQSFIHDARLTLRG